MKLLLAYALDDFLRFTCMFYVHHCLNKMLAVEYFATDLVLLRRISYAEVNLVAHTDWHCLKRFCLRFEPFQCLQCAVH